MSTAYSPRSKDDGWANVCPYIVLTVTKDSETSTTVKYSYSLDYKTQGSIPSANSEKREWTVKFGSTTASSGSKAINGKSSVDLTDGDKSFTITKTTSSQTISVVASFDFNITWSGVHKNVLKTTSISLSIPALASYSVTYSANGGSGAPSTQTKYYGKSLTLSSTKPTRTNYTFSKWNTNSSGTGTSYSPGGSYTSNAALALYAVWKENTYTVTYNANNGSNAPSAQTKYATKNLTLTTSKPTRTGYSFAGWNTKADGSGTNYSSGGTYSSNASVTLYAKWTKIQYTISYNLNEGSGVIEAQTKDYGVSINLSSVVPTRQNYIFEEWNTLQYGGGNSYSPGQAYSINASLTLWAQWKVATSDPSISALDYTRVINELDSEGNYILDPLDGEYILVTFSFACDTSYNPSNVCESLTYVLSTASDLTPVDIDSEEWSGKSTGTVHALIEATKYRSSYLQIAITDSEGITIKKSIKIQPGAYPIDILKGGSGGLSIGGPSEAPGLDVHGEAFLDGYLRFGGRGQDQDTEAGLHFKTAHKTKGLGDYNHDCQIFGGNPNSKYGVGVYDRDNLRMPWVYDDSKVENDRDLYLGDPAKINVVMRGKTNKVDGGFNIIGALAAASVTASGKVKAGSMESTGALTASNVTASGKVKAGSMESTGALTASSVTIGGHNSAIGSQLGNYGAISVTLPASTWTTAYSISLPAGVWIVDAMVRLAKSTSTDAANVGICISDTNNDNNTTRTERTRVASSDQDIYLKTCTVLTPPSTTTYYLTAYSSKARSINYYRLLAVRIR